MLPWIVLIGSGAFEAVWATALAASEGLRKWRPTLVFLITNVVSLLGLAWAMRYLPTGTAYAVWVGIGASLTSAWAMIRGREAVEWRRIAFLLLLVGCVVGLKAVS